MQYAIRKAIEEFTPLYDEVTTSDLQGICEARAINILRTFGHLFDVNDVPSVMAVSEQILRGIYENIERSA
jgi:hypothetical protein